MNYYYLAWAATQEDREDRSVVVGRGDEKQKVESSSVSKMPKSAGWRDDESL